MKNLLLILFIIFCGCDSTKQITEDRDARHEVQSVDSERVLEESILQSEFLDYDASSDAQSD